MKTTDQPLPDWISNSCNPVCVPENFNAEVWHKISARQVEQSSEWSYWLDWARWHPAWTTALVVVSLSIGGAFGVHHAEKSSDVESKQIAQAYASSLNPFYQSTLHHD